MSFANVVFPDPVSPTIATEDPAGKSTFIPCRTRSPSRYANSIPSAFTDSGPV